MKHYDVIVVGAGLAGLTAAAFLSRDGHSTLICEKNDRVGGLVHSFTDRGFTFDAGTRAFENSGILVPMINNLGLDIELKHSPVSIGIADEWVQLRTSTSLSGYAGMLKTLFPEEERAIDQIFREMGKASELLEGIYSIDHPSFEKNPKDTHYVLNTLLPWMFRNRSKLLRAMKMNEPIQQYLERFTEHQPLIDMITQHFFLDTPTFFALSYSSMYQQYSYPLGGTGVLPERLAAFITAHGGEIALEHCVQWVDQAQRIIYTKEGESYHYDQLIWAADQRMMYRAVQDQSADAQLVQMKLAESRSAESILTAYLAVDMPPSMVETITGPHAFYTPQTSGLRSLEPWIDAATSGPDALYDWITRYLIRTTLEISCPAVNDASLAPEGQSGLIVSTLFDYQLTRFMKENDDYEVFKKHCERVIIDLLHEQVYPQLKENILFSRSSTPLSIAREAGTYQGAIAGWSFSNEDMPMPEGFQNVPKAIDTPFMHIYQCGQWTFRPSGLPIAILTGKLAADAVREQRKDT